MIFDPFGDFETQGYSRNLAKEKEAGIFVEGRRPKSRPQVIRTGTLSSAGALVARNCWLTRRFVIVRVRSFCQWQMQPLTRQPDVVSRKH
jgi:hypothetical protein